MREQTDMQGKTPTPLLVAIGDAQVRHAIVSFLQQEGYTLVIATHGEQAMHVLKEQPCMLALVDLSLPGRDGLDLCRIIRTHRILASLPVLLMAVQPNGNEEMEAIVSLEVGADDYVTWPLNWRVFHARVRALLRRSQHLRCCPDPEGRELALSTDEPETREVVVGNMRIDPDGREVFLNGQPVELSMRLFDLLLYFVSHQGVVLSRKQLFEHIQGGIQDDFVASREQGRELHSTSEDRLLDVYVHWLREKIEEDVAHPQRIHTIRGIGYRFMG